MTFLDGRKVTGVLMKIEREALTLRIGPIEQRFATREIDRWETLPPISVRYREMRASIPDGTPTRGWCSRSGWPTRSATTWR